MKKSVLSLIIIVACIAAVSGVYYGNQNMKAESNAVVNLESATVLPQPRPVTEFKLWDNTGKPFDNKNLLGHWTLLFFGFTHCPHICPMTMAELKKAYKIMQTDKIPTPQVVLITIDPERDTMSRLDAYVKAFNVNFKGARGSKEELDKLTKNLNIVYMQVKQNNPKITVDFDHSASILLINPEGKLAAIFSMPHKAEQIAHDFNLIQKYRS